MKNKLFLGAAVMLLMACSSQVVNSGYGRPSIGYGESFAHCNTMGDGFWNYVSTLERGPGTLEIEYRRHVNASMIYRGDCSGDIHSCNNVKYVVTDVNGRVKKFRSNDFDPGINVKITGMRIKHLKMEGAISGRGVDRQGGPVIACPM